MVARLRKHAQHFKQFHAEGVRSQDAEYAKRATEWIEGAQLQAASERLGAPLIVWRQDWRRSTFAPKFKDGWAMAARKAKSIVLLVQASHHTSLKPPEGKTGEAVPAWLTETHLLLYEQYKGAAARETQQAQPHTCLAAEPAEARRQCVP